MMIIKQRKSILTGIRQHRRQPSRHLNSNKKAVLSQGNHALPTPNDYLLLFYIQCIKADVNVKL